MKSTGVLGAAALLSCVACDVMVEDGGELDGDLENVYADADDVCAVAKASSSAWQGDNVNYCGQNLVDNQFPAGQQGWFYSCRAGANGVWTESAVACAGGCIPGGQGQNDVCVDPVRPPPPC